MEEILKSLAGAHITWAFVTVLLVQAVKGAFLPNDPNAPVGAGRWTSPKRLGRLMQVLAFFVATGLSVAFDPHEAQSVVGKLGDGLQTGAASIAIWEIYSKWFQPLLVKK